MAKRLNITPSLDEKIQLYNMTEEVLWADLDRYVDHKLEIEIYEKFASLRKSLSPCPKLTLVQVQVMDKLCLCSNFDFKVEL